MGILHQIPQIIPKPGPRADELTFQDKLCQYVPNGGEVITPNSRNDLDAAIQTLQTMHVSYLNKDYDPDVINKKWKTSLYSGSDLLYHGMTGYNYISCHLGYRYVLTASAFSPGQVSITVENKGFSSCYRSAFGLTYRNLCRWDLAIHDSNRYRYPYLDFRQKRYPESLTCRPAS